MGLMQGLEFRIPHETPNSCVPQSKMQPKRYAASKRRGDNSKGFRESYLKAKAKTWP